MSAVPLVAHPPAVPGHRLVRSGLRWLCADGEPVRANQPVAYCNIGVVADAGPAPFAEESLDLQLTFAPRMGGTFRRAEGVSRGGFLDRLNNLAWDAPIVLGRIEDPPADATPDARLLVLAGRRFGEIAGDRSGLLTGWHDQVRGWWGEGDGPHATLLALGTCEQATLLRGDRGAFAEMFALLDGPVQLIVGADEPLVPCARTIAEQLRFTDDDRAAIRADLAASILAGPHPPTAEEWVFLGALLDALTRSPLTETPDLLTATGIVPAVPPAALSLSLTAELPQAGRHRALGYTLNCHGFRLARVGPAVRHWLRTSFEPVPRDPETIRADYRELLALLRLRGTKLLVHNSVSSLAYEQVQDYAALDDASFAGLGSLRAKTLNLMLHDLAREHPALRIIDVDAIVADLGMAAHLPDGVHPSGMLQAEIRAEFVRVAASAGLVGFGPIHPLRSP